MANRPAIEARQPGGRSKAIRPKATSLRSGFVTLLGRPNSGKSTLVNALVGRKVAIVTPHPQTTRTHLLGIVNLPAAGARPPAQIVLVDTPGVHQGRRRVDRELMRSVREGLEGRDLCLLIVDVTRPFGAEDAMTLRLLQGSEAPLPTLLLLNKIDRLDDKTQLLPLLQAWRARGDFQAMVPLSALRGENLDLLLGEIVSRLPAGPAYFEAGQVTDQPERFLISELIREQAMLLTREEVPHSLAVRIEKDETNDRVRVIHAALVCERAGQKAILVGRGGEMIRAIGTESRRALDALLGTRIFLQLQVLVRRDWRESASALRENLGFRHE